MDSKQLYKLAYDAHYSKGEPENALEMYKQVIEQFPDSAEAGYAKSQIKNLEVNMEKFKAKPLPEEYNVKLTTAPRLEGYRISETLEIITAECVCGIDILEDFFTSMTDLLGGRSGTTQNILRDARKTCLRELKREALELGANAVIGVDLKYSEFSGKGKSMLFVVTSGTAVKVQKAVVQQPDAVI